MSNEIIAGVAKTVITPSKAIGTRMGGFGLDRKSEGVHDPLWARAIYLKQGEEEVVLVAMDLVGLMHNRIENIRTLVKSVKPQAVIPCSTHCHASPDTIGYWGPGIAGIMPYKSGMDQEYMAELERRVAETVDKAVNNAQPAKLAFTSYQTPEHGFNDNIRDKSIIDRSVRMMSVRTCDGEPLALVTSYACHPEMLWFDNKQLSADFVGIYNDAIEKSFGGMSLYFSAALGGMVTGDLHWDAPKEERWPYIEWLGRELANLSVENLPDLDDHKTDLPLKHVSSRFSFKAENWKLKLVQKIGVVEDREKDGMIETEMNLISLGGARFLSVPGEALPELGRRLQEKISGEPAIILGLACDELGYMPPVEYFEDKNYKYERSMSMGPKLSAALLEQAQLMAERIKKE